MLGLAIKANLFPLLSFFYAVDLFSLFSIRYGANIRAYFSGQPGY